MKKILALIIVFVISGMAYAASYDAVKEVNNLNVKIMMDSDPPTVGEKDLDITVTDSTSTPVTDAKIKIEYSMPPMHGMPSMKYKARAKSAEGGYRAKINLSMSGQWNIAVSIKRPGTLLTKVPFKVDVQ